jgi:hypothetical protein
MRKRNSSLALIRAQAYNKNQILSPRVELRPKPDFFIYIVKPEPEPKPEFSPTYLVTFTSPKSPSSNHEARARPVPEKIRPDPSLIFKGWFTLATFCSNIAEECNHRRQYCCQQLLKHLHFICISTAISNP